MLRIVLLTVVLATDLAYADVPFCGETTTQNRFLQNEGLAAFWFESAELAQGQDPQDSKQEGESAAHTMVWRGVQISLATIRQFKGMDFKQTLAAIRRKYGDNLRVILIGDKGEKLGQDTQSGEFEHLALDAKYTQYYATPEGQAQTNVKLGLTQAAAQFLPPYYYPNGPEADRPGADKGLIVLGPRFSSQMVDGEKEVSFQIEGQRMQLLHELVHKWVNDKIRENVVEIDGKKIAFEHKILSRFKAASERLQREGVRTVADGKKKPDVLLEFLQADLERNYLWGGEEIDVHRLVVTHYEDLGLEPIDRKDALSHYDDELQKMKDRIGQYGKFLSYVSPEENWSPRAKKLHTELSKEINTARRRLQAEDRWRASSTGR